jgi:hypothetical protein
MGERSKRPAQVRAAIRAAIAYEADGAGSRDAWARWVTSASCFGSRGDRTHDTRSPVAQWHDMASPSVSAPFVHEMFHSAYQIETGFAPAAQIGDEAWIAHRGAAEYAGGHRRFLQKGLDPLQQLLFHNLSLIAPKPGDSTNRIFPI